jgi:FkbM family methyltransferase
MQIASRDGQNDRSGCQPEAEKTRMDGETPRQGIPGTHDDARIPRAEPMAEADTQMNYRSQFGEDRWIEKNWSSLWLPDHGTFVEFGAGDGVHFSNTYWLEKDRGWNGLLIEPDPRTEIKDRTAIIERCVIGTGAVAFGLHPTDAYLSGILRDSPNRMEVEAVPLSALLLKHHITRVDLISIDTEGTEVEAWRTLDLNIWRPTVAIIELYTWKLSDRSHEILDMMKADGYRLMHRTECNGIFRLTGPLQCPVEKEIS